jgi:threonine synthase
VKSWTLKCSACPVELPGDRLASLCPDCSQPLAVIAGTRVGRSEVGDEESMWRYGAALPLGDGEQPVSLGEGMTPLLDASGLAGIGRMWVKDESINPTGSFKARGMAAAVTRAKALGVRGLVVPTAGNAGAALAAYGAAAGLPVCVTTPRTTPRPILETIRSFGAELILLDGHIGDAGKEAARQATDRGFFNVATAREPYRIEGMKTMGYEVAQQLGWRLPDVIVYPTGGGEGVVGIWKAFNEMLEWGWIEGQRKPRMVVAQAEGCATFVRAIQEGSDRVRPWESPVTSAWGLRVPAPLADRMVMRAVAESGGTAAASSEAELSSARDELARKTGVDAAPEGGCALAVVKSLIAEGLISSQDEVVLFNTGSGAAYR